MSKKQYPSVEYVRQCFRYENGKLFWLVRPRNHFLGIREWRVFNAQFSGKEAGYNDKMNGGDRWKVSINIIHKKNSRFYRYIIIWAMHNGRWPNGTVDHKDHNPSNDRIDNLREATRKQNQQNMKKSVRNTSGFKGVSRLKNNNRWGARMRLNGEYKHLGSYLTPEEAHKAYCEAALKYHGEFACTG